MSNVTGCSFTCGQQLETPTGAALCRLPYGHADPHLWSLDAQPLFKDVTHPAQVFGAEMFVEQNRVANESGWPMRGTTLTGLHRELERLRDGAEMQRSLYTEQRKSCEDITCTLGQVRTELVEARAKIRDLLTKPQGCAACRKCSRCRLDEIERNGADPLLVYQARALVAELGRLPQPRAFGWGKPTTEYPDEPHEIVVSWDDVAVVFNGDGVFLTWQDNRTVKIGEDARHLGPSWLGDALGAIAQATRRYSWPLTKAPQGDPVEPPPPAACTMRVRP